MVKKTHLSGGGDAHKSLLGEEQFVELGAGRVLVHGRRRAGDGRDGRLRALVVHQVVAAPISAAAPIAAERFLALVDEHVRLELIRVWELWRAQLAGVGSLAGVHPEVAPQIGHLHELPLAVRAMIRFFARVQSHVRLEVMVPGEAFVALGTGERFFAGVGALVVLQHVFVAEASVTHAALEHLVAAGGAALAAATRRQRLGHLGRRRRRRQRLERRLWRRHFARRPAFLGRFGRRRRRDGRRRQLRPVEEAAVLEEAGAGRQRGVQVDGQAGDAAAATEAGR